MAEPAKKQEVMEEADVPRSGIGQFIPTDEEYSAMEADDAARAKKDFGETGIAQFSDVANEMASYGRFGDDMIAHVQTGELVIPAKFVADPVFKEILFNNLREKGIEDPERYVVGSDANIINPQTGMPEFFLKKIFKGVKKAFKSVTKVLKKVAPIVLPIALNFVFPGLGAIASGALGAGLGTLIQGGDIGDALSAAAVGGITGGIFSGVSGGFEALSSGGSFGSGFMGGLNNALPASSLGEAFTVNPAIKSAVSNAYSSVTGSGAASASPVSGQVAAAKNLGPSLEGLQQMPGSTPIPQARPTGGVFNPQNLAPQTLSGGAGAGSGSIAGGSLVDPSFAAQNLATAAPGGVFNPQNLAPQTLSGGAGAGSGSIAGGSLVDPSVTAQNLAPQTLSGGAGAGSGSIAGGAPKSVLQRIAQSANELSNQSMLEGTNMLTGFNKVTAQSIIENAGVTSAEIAANPGILTTAKALADAATQPSLLARYGPPVALAGLAASAGGFFDTPEEEPIDMTPFEGPTEEQIAEYRLPEEGLQSRGSTGPYEVVTNYPFYRPPSANANNPFIRAKDGGGIFPRRNGGIMPDEGVPDQDSVRALLMPGEFVMTKTAVRGLGNGDLNRGIKNMYSVMRDLEARGRSMA